MPIKTNYLETAIYQQVWVNNVTLTEIENAFEDIRALADEDEVGYYAVIIRMNHATTYTYDVASISEILQKNKRVAAIILVDTPQHALSLAQLLDNILRRISIIMLSSQDNPLDEAKRLIAIKHVQENPDATFEAKRAILKDLNKETWQRRPLSQHDDEEH